MSLRIEIKHRQLNFTDRYPFRTVIVDWKPSFDRLRPAAFAYMIFNKPRTHFVLVMVGRTRRFWVETTKKHRDGRVLPYYECPVDKCSIHTIEEVKEWTAFA